jgi:asparagine synthase (glutamine-hydrolysing)
MCGFLFIKTDNKSYLNKIANKFDNLKYRGPDYSFSIIPEENIFIGQHVLSVVGNLNQKHYKYKNLYLLYNGEIYNYDKSFENDTEFLSHYLYHNWDNVDLSKLDGMYSFVAYKDGEIMMARDPFGQKPLYFKEKKNSLVVSSGVNVFEDELEIDYDVYKNYFFTRHFIDNGKSIYKDINQLIPGCLRLNNKDKFFTAKDFITEPFNFTEDECLEELDSLLRRTIKEMIPDRKFSSIISGGIDSSLVSWYLSRENIDVRFLGMYNLDKDWVSSNLKKFESYLNKDILQLNCFKKKWVDAFKYYIETTKDLPRTWASISYYLISKEWNEKVMFTGEGADELFGGYKDYLDEGITKYSSYDRRDIFTEMPEYFEPIIEDDVFLTDTLNMIPVGSFAADSGIALNGKEGRNPFLRYDVVKFALNLPKKYKIKNGVTKYILKELFKQKYKEDLIYKKQGFSGYPEDCYKIEWWKMDDFEKVLGYNIDPIGDDKWKLACGNFLYQKNYLNL